MVARGRALGLLPHGRVASARLAAALAMSAVRSATAITEKPYLVKIITQKTILGDAVEVRLVEVSQTIPQQLLLHVH